MNIAGEEIHNSGKWFYFKFTIFLKWARNTPLQSYEISRVFTLPIPNTNISCSVPSSSLAFICWLSSCFTKKTKALWWDYLFLLTSKSGIHLCFCLYSLLFLPTCLLILLLFKGIDQPCFFYITNVFLSNGCFPLEL